MPLSLSTLADQVGAGCAVLEPLRDRIERHVLAAERLHGDDTTVPVLAKGKTVIGRCWVYVRDDRPFGSRAPPAGMFYYSRDRRGEHVPAMPSAGQPDERCDRLRRTPTYRHQRHQALQPSPAALTGGLP